MKVGDLVRITKGGKKYRGSMGIIISFADELSSPFQGASTYEAFFPVLGKEMWWTESHLEVISESR